VNVLYIVTAFSRGPDDVITPWMVETIHRLADRGTGVEVLAPSYRGLGDQVVDGIRVHRFRYAPRAWETLTHDQTAPDRIREKPWYLALVPGYLAAGTAAAIRLARSGRFDVLHAFWPLPHGLIAAAASRVSGVPMVSTFFGVELSWVESDLRPLRAVIRGIVRASDATTVISSHTAAQVRRLVPEAALRTIPFGAAVATPAAPVPRPRWSERPGELLFVGRLVERKGVHVLLEALGRMRPDLRVRLRVVGDGPLRPALEARARELGLGDRVVFSGFVPSRSSAAPRRGGRAGPPRGGGREGRHRGAGGGAARGAVHGTPVIASAAGGIVDIVRHEETGLLVPPGDAQALAAAIERYADDPALARALALRGREHAVRDFSGPAIADRLAALYHEVARPDRRPAGSHHGGELPRERAR
jgi:glycosyltransferase involved in cell wall biosynthesis